jgi:hypothetical protein
MSDKYPLVLACFGLAILACDAKPKAAPATAESKATSTNKPATKTASTAKGALARPSGKSKPATATYVDGLKKRKHRGLQHAHPALKKAVDKVLMFCDVQDHGPIRSCKKPEVLEKLKTLEKTLWPDEIVLSYCHGMADWDFLAKNLATVRLNTIVTPDKAAKTKASVGLDCVLMAIKSGLLPPYQMHIGIRVATLLSGPLGKQESVLQSITDPTKKSFNHRAYYANLWGGGRLSALPKIASYFSALKDPVLKESLMRGFESGAKPEKAELKPLCAFLSQAMADEDVGSADYAAKIAAGSCPSLFGQVIEKLSAADKRNGHVLLHVKTLTALMASKPNAKQKKAILDQYQLIASKTLNNSGVRSYAFRELTKADSPRAKRLVKASKDDVLIVKLGKQLHK